MKRLALHEAHAEAGAHFGELAGHEVVQSYGSVRGEYQAAQTGAALTDLSSRGFIRLGGPDRVPFLHGMVTNDVKGLPGSHVAPAALLTAKGAMVSDARLWSREEDL